MQRFLILLFFVSPTLACACEIIEDNEPRPTKTIKCVDDYLRVAPWYINDESRLINFLRLGFECELKRPFSLRDFKPDIVSNEMRVSHTPSHLYDESSELDDQLRQKLTYFFQDEPLALSGETLQSCRTQVLELCIAAIRKFHADQFEISRKFICINDRLQRHTLFSVDEPLLNGHKQSYIPSISCDADDCGKELRGNTIHIILCPVKDVGDDITPTSVATCTLGTILVCATSLSLYIQNDEPPEAIVTQCAQILVDAFPAVRATEPRFVLKCMNVFLVGKRNIPQLNLDAWRGFLTTHEKLLDELEFKDLQNWFKPPRTSRVQAVLSRASKSALNVLSNIPSPKLSPRNRAASTDKRASPRSPREGRNDLVLSAPALTSRKSFGDGEL